ncbi:BglG family transcription antiterminator [Desmospora activa]|uniref:BglG family transcriptional antiterminator n=1 Tax=Desmospora activa DSM 45169 TaxID=1121389 RepID=A0A2T4ZCB2_9BACL|nr:BglG family transcription antiterminator [Desmospora activa]PTM59530.1 BglG family transcriptional antiterminator [Desmospora activa DSM 45169]
MVASLTSRQRFLALHLLAREEFETVAALSAGFRVSPRTIRYDLKLLEGWFGEWGLELERRPRRGVILRGGRSERERAEIHLDTPEPRIVPLTKEERIRSITLFLLVQSDGLTVDQLARELDISRGTVLRDLDVVQKQLVVHGVVVERIPGRGLYTRSSEFHWRQAAAVLLTDMRQDGEYRSLPLQSGSDPFSGWPTEAMMREFEETLSRWGSPLVQALSGSALQVLAVYLALMVVRLKAGKWIEKAKKEPDDVKPLPEYAEALRLSHHLEERFCIDVPESETVHLTLRLLGAQRFQVLRTEIGENDPSVGRVVDGIIRVVSDMLQMPLERDKELQEGLSVHLKPALIRLRFGFFIKNPLLKEVRSRYPRIYAASQKAAFWVERVTGHSVPPSEIGYIAMHIGAAVWRFTATKPTVRRVLLVCASGVGTAKLLESHLRRELSGVVWTGVSTAAKAKEEAERHQVDFVISTLPLDDSFPDLPVHFISPVPTWEEIQILREKLLFVRRPERVPPISRLMALIDEHAHIRNRKGLEKRLTEWMGNHFSMPSPEVSSFSTGRMDCDPMLDQLLKSEHLCLQQSCSDWKEAVNTGARPLLERGMIERSYVEQIVRNMIEHGAYMVIAPGIALLHARPEDGVNAVCMSLLTLDEGVSFGHEANDPVDVVITFATLDNNMHLTALSQLMELLSDEQRLERLREAKTSPEAQRVIQPFLP